MSTEKAKDSLDKFYKRYATKTPPKLEEDEAGVAIIEKLDTPFISFDRHLGGGLVLGKMATLSGEFSVGKTSLALAIAGYNKDKVVGFLDQEFEWLDPLSYDWVEKYFGIERERMIVLQPGHVQESGQMVSDLCDVADIVIIDGVTSIPTKAQYEDAMDAYKMAEHARILNSVIRKIRGKVYETKTAMFITNHVYEAIGGYKGELKEPGGRGLGYYPSQKLRLTKAQHKATDGEHLGQKVNIRVTKDKVSGGLEDKFQLIYTKQVGFEPLYDLINNAIDMGLIKKSGSWYSFDGNNLGQGVEKVKQFILDNPGLEKELRTAILTEINK